jgi:beta-glucosidase
MATSTHCCLLALPLLAQVAAAPAGPPPPARAAALLSSLNFSQKLQLLSGVDGLGWGCAGQPSAACTHPYVGNVRGLPERGVPWLSLQDGPQGYRDGPYGKYQPGASGTATQWPSGLAVAATWDRALAGRWGAAMGAEFRAKGANVQLGPGMNLARVPVGGRNFECPPPSPARLAGPLHPPRSLSPAPRVERSAAGTCRGRTRFSGRS